jgi:hypothetical protein
VFKRDAVSTKAVALAALGVAYLAAPLHLPSLTVMAAGFLLNSLAAAALGPDRTYYGHEVAGLPARRITVFPYSAIAHPMLLGNVAAFGGTMLNAGFREQWWPLACVHVALNLGLLAMELRVRPGRRNGRGPRTGEAPLPARPSGAAAAAIIAAGAALGAVAGPADASGTAVLPGTVLGACAAAYACVLYRSYSSPRTEAPR